MSAAAERTRDFLRKTWARHHDGPGHGETDAAFAAMVRDHEEALIEHYARAFTRQRRRRARKETR